MPGDLFGKIAPDPSEPTDLGELFDRIERYAQDLDYHGFAHTAAPLARLCAQGRGIVEEKADEIADLDKRSDKLDEREAEHEAHDTLIAELVETADAIVSGEDPDGFEGLRAEYAKRREALRKVVSLPGFDLDEPAEKRAPATVEEVEKAAAAQWEALKARGDQLAALQARLDERADQLERRAQELERRDLAITARESKPVEAPAVEPAGGKLCSICLGPQTTTPEGVTCRRGHTNAPAIERPAKKRARR